MDFLLNLLKGITKPGRDIAETGRLLSQVRQMDPEINKNLKTLADRQAAQSRVQSYEPLYQTGEEQVAQFTKPVQTTLRDAAIAGSMFAPVGQAANIASRAGAGAFGSTLAGYGMTPVGQDYTAKNLVGDVALGGILGGTIGAVEKGLANKAAKVAETGKKASSSKIADYMAKQRGEAIGLDPNKLAGTRGTGVKSGTKGEEVINQFFNSMDELKLPTSTSNAASKSADQALGIYGEQFGNILSNADEAVTFSSKNTDDILNALMKEAGNNKNVMKSASVQEILLDLAGLGDNYSPSQLNAVREKARNSINWARSGKMPNAERGISALYEAMDDLFKKAVPETAETLGKMRNIYTVRPSIQVKARTADVVPIGTVSTNVKAPTFGAQEVVQSGVGKLGQALQGKSLANIGGGDSQILQKLLGVGQQAIPAVSGGLAASQQPQTGTAQGMGQGIGTGQMQQPQQQGPQLDQMKVMQAVLNGQLSTTEANMLMEMFGGSSQQGSESSRLDTAINEMERLYGVGTPDSLSIGDKNVGLGGLLAKGGVGLTKAFDQNYMDRKTAYDQQKALALGIINKAREAGTLNEGEFQVLIENVPNEYTTETVARDWFNNVRKLLGGASSSTQTVDDIGALSQMLGL